MRWTHKIQGVHVCENEWGTVQLQKKKRIFLFLLFLFADVHVCPPFFNRDEEDRSRIDNLN